MVYSTLYYVTMASLNHDQETIESDNLTLVELEFITQIVSLVAELITLFGVGCNLTVKKENVATAKGVCIGLFLHTIVLPFVGFSIGKVFHLEPLDALSILATTTAPIAGYSCVLTYWAAGDVHLCVLLAALSTTLSIGFIPLWIFLYHPSLWHTELYLIAPPEDVTMYLFAVLIPTGLGALLHRFFPTQTPYVTRVCSCAFLIKVLVTSILFIIFHPEQFLVDWHAWVGTFLIPSVGFLVGFISAYMLRLPYKLCVAISLAVGASNGNMVVSLALNSEKDQTVLARVLQVPGIYVLLAPIQGTIWALMFRRFKFIDDNNPTIFGNKYDSGSLSPMSDQNIDNDDYDDYDYDT